MESSARSPKTLYFFEFLYLEKVKGKACVEWIKKIAKL